MEQDTFEAPASSTLMECDWQMMVEEAVALYGYSCAEQEDHVEGAGVIVPAESMYQQEATCNDVDDLSALSYHPCLHLTMMYHEEKWHHISTEIWARLNEPINLPFVTNFELDHVISKKDYLCPSPIANNSGVVNSRRQSKAFPVYVKKSAELFSWVVSYLHANAPYHLQMVSDTQLLVTFTCQEHIHLLLELLNVFSSYECGERNGSDSNAETDAPVHDNRNTESHQQSTSHACVTMYEDIGNEQQEIVRAFQFDDDQRGDNGSTSVEQEPPMAEYSGENAASSRGDVVREKIARYFSKILPFPMLQCWRVMLAKLVLPAPSSPPEAVVYSTRWWNDIVAVHHISDDWRPIFAPVNKKKARQNKNAARRQRPWAHDSFHSAASAYDESPSDNLAEQEPHPLMQFVYRKIKSIYSGRLVPWMYWDVPQLQSTATVHASSDDVHRNQTARLPVSSPNAHDDAVNTSTHLPTSTDNKSQVSSPTPAVTTSSCFAPASARPMDNRANSAPLIQQHSLPVIDATASTDKSYASNDGSADSQDASIEIESGAMMVCDNQSPPRRESSKRRITNGGREEESRTPKRRRQRAPSSRSGPRVRASDRSSSAFDDSSTSTTSSLSSVTRSDLKSSAYDVSSGSDGSCETVSLSSSSSTSVSFSLSDACDSHHLQQVRRDREVAHSLGKRAPMVCFVSPFTSRSASPRSASSSSNFFDNRRFVK